MRKTYPNGAREAIDRYERRTYCDRTCAAMAYAEQYMKDACEECGSNKNLGKRDGKTLCYNCRRITPPKCKVDGCEGEGKRLGYCQKHYNRFRKYGDPLKYKVHATDGWKVVREGDNE